MMVNSGFHLLDGLQCLADQVQDEELRGAINGVARRVSSGHRLSQAMASHRPPFKALECSLVKVGEETGGLHMVLSRLADMAEQQEENRQRLISALTYPAIVVLIAFSLLVFAPIFVFDDLLGVIRELGADLPLITRAYLGLAQWVTSPAFYLVLAPVLGLGFWGLKTSLQAQERRATLERFLLDLPGVGHFLRTCLSLDLSLALGLCYRAGLPVLESLQLSRHASPSVWLADQLQRAREALTEGETLTQALADMQLFEPACLSLIAVGEESGQVEETLETVSVMCRQDRDHALEVAQAMLEPLLLLGVGLMVGFIAVATLLPMLQVAQNL